ncbi:MAG: hypothetical protein ABI234_04435 [Ktedonobacteraceae bacterium]
MSHFDLFIAALDARERFGGLTPLRLLFILGDIAGFFTNLYTDLIVFALAMSTFFFAWAAVLYGASGMSGNDRTKQQAMGALYAALIGLALALLAGTVAGIINSAAAGQ